MFTKVWLRDVAERTLATFLQAFLGLLIVADKVDLSTAQVAYSSGLVAALAVVKGALAGLYGDKDSASLDPELKVGLAAAPVPAKRAARKRPDAGEAVGGVLWTVFLVLAIIALLVWLF